MKLTPLLDQPCSQADFAEMVGLSEARVSQLTADGIIPRGETGHNMLLAYCERLRDQAAGRAGTETGGLDLVQERAALAREQRIAQELKNKVARGEFAPVGLLSDVLGRAASGIVDRFDQIEGSLRKACPDISDDVLMTVLGVVNAARNETIRATAKLADAVIDQAMEEGDGEESDDGTEHWLRTGLKDPLGPDDDDGTWETQQS